MLKTNGWQTISFYCKGTYIEYRTLNDIMKGVPFGVDDQILYRHPDYGLMLATYTGTKFVGSLVRQGLSYQRGYKVFYSGPVDAVISQTGYPYARCSVSDVTCYVVLYKGWNYIGVICPSLTLTHPNPNPNRNPKH